MKETIQKLIKNWRPGYCRGVSVTDVLQRMRRCDDCIHDWNNRIIKLISLWEKLDFENLQQITEESGWEEVECDIIESLCSRHQYGHKRLKNPQAQALCEFLINIFNLNNV